MTGYELIERVVARFREAGQEPPPACAVSAHARPEDKRRAIEAGFDFFLTKPVTDKQLLETVRELKSIAGLET